MKADRVSEDKNLLRRAFGPPDKRFLNPDGSATSRVFKLRKNEGELSVDVKEMVIPEKSVIDQHKFVLFEISVVSVEALGLWVTHDPLTLKDHGIENQAHALIFGLEESDETKPGLLARSSKRIFFN